MYVSDTKAELVLSSPLEVNWDMILTLISLNVQYMHRVLKFNMPLRFLLYLL